MSGIVDRTRQLVEASRHGRFGQKASLQAKGTELPQHNTSAPKHKAKKKASAKKTEPKKAPAKKTAAKKSAATKPAKKAAKKS